MPNKFAKDEEHANPKITKTDDEDIVIETYIIEMPDVEPCEYDYMIDDE